MSVIEGVNAAGAGRAAEHVKLALIRAAPFLGCKSLRGDKGWGLSRTDGVRTVERPKRRQVMRKDVVLQARQLRNIGEANAQARELTDR